MTLNVFITGTNFFQLQDTCPLRGLPYDGQVHNATKEKLYPLESVYWLTPVIVREQYQKEMCISEQGVNNFLKQFDSSKLQLLRLGGKRLVRKHVRGTYFIYPFCLTNPHERNQFLQCFAIVPKLISKRAHADTMMKVGRGLIGVWVAPEFKKMVKMGHRIGAALQMGLHLCGIHAHIF